MNEQEFVCNLCGETFPINVPVLLILAHISAKHQTLLSLFFEKKIVSPNKTNGGKQT